MPSRALAAPIALALFGTAASAQVSDFTFWTLAEDPADPGFNAVAATTSATLTTAGASVPLNTDIGFQSVTGLTAGTSAGGFAFVGDQDFSLAIDYDFSSAGFALGVLSFGFGIGLDGAGANSAGVGFVTQNGSPFGPFGGAGRQNDSDLDPIALPLNAAAVGTLFVGYEAATGNVTFGAATTPGAATPTASDTFVGIGSAWMDHKILASFFMRSGPLLAWQTGNASAVFSNFRVLEGDPVFLAVACSVADITEFGACRPGCPDGSVDLSDFSCFLALWADQDPLADLTGFNECLPGTPDGQVTLSDFSCYLAEWALGCP
ncbi:MAG: GC-type dockerin domain-anchored protein [Planctomycetota bacterium]